MCSTKNYMRARGRRGGEWESMGEEREGEGKHGGEEGEESKHGRGDGGGRRKAWERRRGRESMGEERGERGERESMGEEKGERESMAEERGERVCWWCTSLSCFCLPTRRIIHSDVPGKPARNQVMLYQLYI